MRSSSSRWVILLAVPLMASMATTSPDVHAAEATAADKDAAREAFAEGKELRAKKKYAEALVKFEAAFRLVPSPITALELARTQVLVGQLVEARDSCSKAAAMPPKPDESSQAKLARVDATALAEELRARIPTLVVSVAGGASGVSVFVDGDSIGKAPAKTEVNPGKHRVVAKLSGASDQEATVEVGERESREVVLTFAAPVEPVRDGSPTPGLSPLTYGGFGVAGAGVIIGSIYGVMAIGKRSGPKDGEESYKSTAMVSTVSFVTAGLGAAVGVIGLLTSPSSEPSVGSAPAWRPWISLGSAGVTGTF